MSKWLSDVIKILVGNMQKSPKEPFLQNSLTVLIISYKLEMLFDYCYNMEHSSYLKALLRNMAVEFSSLCQNTVQVLQEHFNNDLLSVMTTLVYGVTSYNPPLSDWIFAVPIIHLLNKECESLQCSNKIDWDHYSTKQK